MTKNCRPSMSEFALIKEKTTSKAIIKRYAQIESPCLVPLSESKYRVPLQLLITRDSGFFSKDIYPFSKFVTKSKFFQHAHQERMINKIKCFFYIYYH